MRSSLKLVGSLLASGLLFVSFGQEMQESRDAQQDPIIEQANKILREQGLKNAHVIKSPEGRLVLAGNFETYDEFLYALMLMRTHFGFDKIAPVYDIRLAVIKKSTAELCFPYAVRGEFCPWGRFTIPKKKAPKEAEKKEVPKEEVKKYALVIGVRDYKLKEIPPVIGADNDAVAFVKYLKDRGYDVKTLLNEEATMENVRKAISEIYSKAKDGDHIVLFAASHGAPIDESGEVGIVLYDSTPEKGSKRFCHVEKPPQGVHAEAAQKMCTIVKNALSVREHIVNTFADKKVNLVVLLDACYSGDVLRSYVGLDLPYNIATTKEYENALRYAPNLNIMATASSGDRQSWGGAVNGEFRERLFRFSGGSPRVINLTGQEAQGQGENSRTIVVIEEKGKKKGEKREKTTFQTPNVKQVQEKSVNHGVFTAFILEGLLKFDGSLAKAYDNSKEDINYVSEKLCLKEKGDKNKCSPGGQNPMLYRIRVQDYIFRR